jgi:hypothetical protein
MSWFYSIAIFSATFTLLTVWPDQAFAAPIATNTPEKTVPQGTDPPGAENGAQATTPLVQDKGVILPPPVGDEEIHTQAPNPHAGHGEEVIPPPGTPGGDPTVEPR